MDIRQSQLPPQAITQQALDAAYAARLTAQTGQASTEAELRRTDTVRAQIALAESNVRELEAKLAQARAQLNQAELNLGWTRLIAPRTGGSRSATSRSATTSSLGSLFSRW